MMNFYSVLLFFFIFGLFNVNSCDCCKGNKSSGSASSAAKSGSHLKDISWRSIEELEKLLIIGSVNADKVEDNDVCVFKNFLGVIKDDLKCILAYFLSRKKIRVFFKDRVGEVADVIFFLSSDVVSKLGLGINNAKLHKINNQIYYFYFFDGINDLEFENNDNVFANLDISKLKWKD